MENVFFDFRLSTFDYICLSGIQKTQISYLWKISLFQQGSTGLQVLIWL